MFKCLIFVQGLTAPEDGEIRTRILSKLEQNPQISLQMVAEECEWLTNLQYNTVKTEEYDKSKINAIKEKQHKEKFACKISPCHGCGQIHYHKECLFRRKECFNCGQNDHRCMHCRSQKIRGGQKWKITVDSTKMENTNKMKRKFMKVGLDTSSDVTLIKEQTWKKISSPTLLKTKKIVHGITGNKLKFVDECCTNVTFMGKNVKIKRICYDSNLESI